MTFEELLDQAIAVLQRRGRVTYRALKRQFNLDDDVLEDLKAEIIKAQRLAVDEAGDVLVWTGSAVTPSAAASAAERTPSAYIPSHLAEKILSSKGALEGERKQVTVLFADLKGSMELLADRDPEEARTILDPVLERMMEAVHRYEGTVNQVMGDGIMALFGAPLAHEDHAVRACYAALRMQDAIGRYAEELRQRQGLDVQIRVGLNSGAVVVRAIGNDLHMDYTAVGQTTHLAARMEQLARPGTTLLTGETLRLVEGYVEVTPLGPVPVKGLPEPIQVYELRRAGPLRSRLHAAAARGLTRFVGRKGELDQLRQALGRASGGHGQVVAIVGEPGVGKSRLVWEVTHSHRVHGWLVLHAGSVSYGKATSYLPVIDLLKGYFAIEDRDGPRTVREKLTGKLLTLDRTQEGSLPALLALLDVPTDDPQWPTLDPPQRRRRTLDAVKRLLLRESQVQPLLVVFEDLHWIDSETQALLDGLVESLPAARLLLLVNYRPEYQHPWGSRTSYTQLRLDPLAPESAEALLGALVGPDAGLEPLKRGLIARTEGNPFFLEESVRALVETGALLGERGAYRLARPLPTVQVPATVQAVLAARIDRLPPGDKALLQTAAVVGKDIPFILLQAIAEPAEDALHAAIGRLQAAEFLYETGLFPEIEYTFKHALTHEVTYGSLLQERRCPLHRQIVETIERLYPDRVAEHIDRLAHHALRGEAWEKAVTYLRQAGEKALARSVYREAVGYFEQALSALRDLPEQRDTREQDIDLRLAMRWALLPSGDSGRALAVLREAKSLAETLDDPLRLAQVSVFLSVDFYFRGENDQAIAAGQRALALATASGEVVLQALANLYLGFAYEDKGEYRRAIDCLGQTVASLEGARRHEHFGQVFLPAVQSRAWLAVCHAQLGMFAEGSALGDEGLRIAEAVAHPGSLMYAAWGSGLLALRQGDLPRALPLLERAVGLCQDEDLLFWFPWMAAALGAVYTLSGRVADAMPLLTQAMEQTIATEMGGFQAFCSLPLSAAHLRAGDLEAAHGLAERTLAFAHEHQERGQQAYALRLLGEIAARRNPPERERAEAHYRQALALAEALTMRPLQTHCHLGLGTLYAKIGRAEQARAELSTAIDLYRAMEMTFWLPQAEAALARVEGQ
jgi:predicted ATPase/class 3 adenylate cyclase